MSELTAAAYAAILDPERKVPGWWKLAPIKCGNGSTDGVQDTFIGPPDLHTARSESWRGEEWLEERDCVWARKYDRNEMINQTQVCLLGKRGVVLMEFWNTDHAAAIAEAVRRVHHGD